METASVIREHYAEYILTLALWLHWSPLTRYLGDTGVSPGTPF